ncbi:serpin-like protein [Deerpox virus W-1170-84]|uniref:Serpin-like protein n=1 Tax=Deerpox virus (strain W-1170-84) TaxID=305676 RepID=Q08F12_DPV84|nr:serpin-like protein [Deerpox virus W-1170-84]ABI99153.1 serpin-like protein [Deerpox virus W-1170-84]
MKKYCILNNNIIKMSLDLGFCILKSLHRFNVVFSPESLKAFLHVLYLGSERETKNELSKYIGHSYSPIRKNHIHNITKVYVDSRLPIHSAFVASMNNMGIEVILEDLTNHAEPIRRSINEWVYEKTNIINFLHYMPDTSILIINAVQFNGLWKYPFLRKKTTMDIFNMDKVSFKYVQMMTTKGIFNAGRYHQSSIVEIPYDNCSRSRMWIVFPDATSNDQLNQLENTMHGDTLKAFKHASRKKYLEISIPKFRIEHSFNAEHLLPSAGIKTLFTNPNLSRMITQGDKEDDLYSLPPSLYQRVILEIDEEGTNTKQTAKKMRRSPQDEETQQHLLRVESLYVNRPFIFIIEYENEILFIGRISIP